MPDPLPWAEVLRRRNGLPPTEPEPFDGLFDALAEHNAAQIADHQAGRQQPSTITTVGQFLAAEPRCDHTDLPTYLCHHCQEITMKLEAQLTAAYRERAHLVAFLTVLYPSVIITDGDPDAPGWALVYVDSPTGQLSWHLSGDDLDLFPHVQRVETSAVTWDNHTTDEKYARIRQLTADLAPFMNTLPSFTKPETAR